MILECISKFREVIFSFFFTKILDLEYTLSSIIMIVEVIKITIQEVAEKFFLSKDTLRYYEKEGLIGPVEKNKSGIREYSDTDLARIEFVKCMRSAGLSIAVLKKYMFLYDEGEHTLGARLELLESERILLQEKIKLMESALEKLEYKIELYKENKMPNI